MSSVALLKYKASRCAELLAKSLMSDELKDSIAQNIANASEEDLDNLLESLEKEQVELEKVERELGKFEKEEKEEWQKLKQKQEDAAQKMADDFLADAIKLQI